VCERERTGTLAHDEGGERSRHREDGPDARRQQRPELWGAEGLLTPPSSDFGTYKIEKVRLST